MRSVLAAAALLCLASPAAALSVFGDRSSITGDCTRYGGFSASPAPLSLENPTPTRSWSEAGFYCGFRYSLDLHVDLEAQRISLSVELEDLGGRVPPLDPEGMGLFYLRGSLTISVELDVAVIDGNIHGLGASVTRESASNPAPGARISRVWQFREPVPIPEPGTAALVALGLYGCGAASIAPRKPR